MSFPRTTHQWLAPLYGHLERAVDFGAPSGYSGLQGVHFGKGTPITQVGNATGVVGFFGNTGIAPIATGGNGILSATYLGASGFASTGVGNSGLYTHLARFADNGGSGTPFTHGDIVRQLKNLGILPA